jgi:hypothetical protein
MSWVGRQAPSENVNGNVRFTDHGPDHASGSKMEVDPLLGWQQPDALVANHSVVGGGKLDQPAITRRSLMELIPHWLVGLPSRHGGYQHVDDRLWVVQWLCEHVRKLLDAHPFGPFSGFLLRQ